MKDPYYDPFNYIRALLPLNKKLFTVKEFAQVLGRSVQFVRDAVKNKHLLGFALEGRSVGKSRKRQTCLIPVDSAVAYLLGAANHTCDDYVQQLEGLLLKCSKEQLEYFKNKIEAKLRELE
jgi:hypothetical protein